MQVLGLLQIYAFDYFGDLTNLADLISPNLADKVYRDILFPIIWLAWYLSQLVQLLSIILIDYNNLSFWKVILLFQNHWCRLRLNLKFLIR